MKMFFTTAIALISLAPGIVSLTVNTPASITQCQPTLITWRDGTPPYYVSVIPGGQTTAPPLKTLGSSNANSETWLANVTPNQYINFVVKDSTGDTAFTDQVLVMANDNTSCMSDDTSVTPGPVSSSPAVSAVSALGSSSSTGAAARPTQASQGTTRVAVATTQASSKTSSHTSTTATGSSHSNSNGTPHSVGAFGVMSLFPIAGALLLFY